MFDYVGRDIDEEAGKRRLWSALITFSVIGLGASVFIGVTALTVKAAIDADLIDLDEMIEFVSEEMAEEALPPPPPPPPPPASAAEEEEEEEEEDIVPDEMVEDIVELDEKIEDKMKDDATKGAEDGEEGGEEGGVVGGVVGGIEGGVLGGKLGGVLTLHWSELEVKRRVYPKYPKAAESLNLGIQTCRVRVFIDVKGVPYDVKMEACPKVFHDETKRAVMKWRWYPAKVNRKKVKAQFQLIVKYKPS